MTFLQKSAAQELREHFGHDPRRSTGSQKIGDGTPLRCGLYVFDIADERHVGRIIAYERGFATVRWAETGWRSEVRCRDLYIASNT